jgi:hypothetical protein
MQKKKKTIKYSVLQWNMSKPNLLDARFVLEIYKVKLTNISSNKEY